MTKEKQPLEFGPNGSVLNSDDISPEVAQTYRDELEKSKRILPNELLWRSFPLEWRFVMGALTFIALAFLSFVFYGSVFFVGFEPSDYLFIGLMLSFFIMLVRDAVVEGNPTLEKNPSYKGRSGLLYALFLMICISLFIASAILDGAERSEKLSRLIWEISEYCYEDGKFLSDRTKQCLEFRSVLGEPLCSLGAEPMNACELELRGKLNK